jgi:hypothetical protein
MGKIQAYDKLSGLNITMGLGDNIEINLGEIRIQLCEVKGSSARIVIKADKDKFKVRRLPARWREKKIQEESAT